MIACNLRLKNGKKGRMEGRKMNGSEGGCCLYKVVGLALAGADASAN